MSYTNSLNTCTKADISEFKNDWALILAEAQGQPVAIVNENRLAFYAVPPQLFNYLIELADDAHLLEKARARENDDTIKVSLDELQRTLS